jgi:hypothetical protein
MSQQDPFAEEPQANDGSTDFFTGGSPPCRFEAVGTIHSGTIVKFEEAQQRDIKSGQPKNWPDGNPAMMLVITLQTNERSPDIDDDDGQRRLYVNKPSGMFAAIKTALGKERFCVGGKLAVKFVKVGKPTQPGFSPPKEYAAKYSPPGIGDSRATPPPVVKPVPAAVQDINAPLDDSEIPF